MRGLGEEKYDSKIKLLDIVQVIFDYLETIEYRSEESFCHLHPGLG